MMTPEREYWLLAANSKSDEYGEQSDKKENEILQNHWLQMQQKYEDNKELGEEWEPWEDEEQRKKQQEEDKTQDGTNGGGVLIWGPR